MKIQSAIIAIALAATGCTHDVGLHDYYPEEVEANFGKAVRANIVAQTVNPEAPSGEALTASAARTAIAQERYEADEVEKPSKASTLRSATTTGSGESK